MISTIVVPVDGSPHANAAVEWASDLALRYGARLVLLHVIAKWQPDVYAAEARALQRAEHGDTMEYDLLQSLGRRVVEPAEKRVRACGVKAVESVIEVGDPAETVLEQAKAVKADLIVMGRRGLGPLPGLLLGSVSSKVVHLSECACLTVK